jgi:hypothetical protein
MLDHFSCASSQEISVQSLPPTLASLISIVSRRDGVALSGRGIAAAMQQMLPSEFKQEDEVSQNYANREADVLAALDWRVEGPSSILLWVETFCKRVHLVTRGESTNAITEVIRSSVEVAEKMTIHRPPCIDYPAWHVAVGIIAARMMSLTCGNSIECLRFLARACCCSTSDVQTSLRM